jgi:hypothetical protein
MESLDTIEITKIFLPFWRGQNSTGDPIFLKGIPFILGAMEMV